MIDSFQRNLAGAAAIVLLTASVPAMAASTKVQEQSALQSTSLTLTQAIATAEQRTGGKAFDAGTDVDHGSPRVVVETNGPNGVQTVTMDAQSGTVLSTHSGGEPD